MSHAAYTPPHLWGSPPRPPAAEHPAAPMPPALLPLSVLCPPLCGSPSSFFPADFLMVCPQHLAPWPPAG